MQAFAAHQPLTVMVDAVRALTQGQAAEALLGHGAGFYVVRSLAWAAPFWSRSCPWPWPATGKANAAAALTRRNQRTRRQQSTFPATRPTEDGLELSPDTLEAVCLSASCFD